MKEIKLLYTSDTHGTGVGYSSRKDKTKYMDTQRRKIEEIMSIARKNKVQAILHGGDFWESPEPSLDVVSKVLSFWKGVQLDKDSLSDQLNTEGDIPIYGIAGNHDLFHENKITLPRTTLGFMNRLGFYKFVTREKPLLLKGDGFSVAVTGNHYSRDIDVDKTDYVVEQKQGDFHIHLTHGMLMAKPVGRIFRHTVVDEIAHTQADLTLCAHNHIGFEPMEIGGKLFCNPGSPFRTNADMKEISRSPKVLVITVNQKGVSLEKVYLKSALPGNDVLDRSAIEAENERKMALEEVKAMISSSGDYQASTAIDVIREISEIESLPKNIRDNAIERIEKYMDLMG